MGIQMVTGPRLSKTFDLLFLYQIEPEIRTPVKSELPHCTRSIEIYGIADKLVMTLAPQNDISEFFEHISNALCR